MAAPKKIITYSILVKGRVQGIGFRPFVYRQAKKFRLTGIVRNTKQGVLIRVQGKNSKKMVEVLKKSPPLLSNITGITIKKLSYKRYVGFSIKKSTNLNQASDLVQIMPDLSVCPECVKDFTDQQNRRYYYPFTNCTQCGPRYSIIRSLPYDRSKTTMKDFTMCKKCAQEYNNPSNRRFHAQPNACNVCGPWLTLFDSNSKTIISNDSIKVLNKTKQLIAHNKIIAIRSIGGFLLACDAKSNMAVNRLRSRKNRPAKPFAIMCKDIQTIQKLCFVNKREIQILKSKIAPIVLLKKKKTNYISEKIAPKNDFLGVMLPYTPLHKLLFSCLPRNANVSRETYLDALVMTSANPKGAPILANANDVVKKLGAPPRARDSEARVVDYILDHNRPIESRCDDSVVFNYMGPVIIRYSRGYVPSPIQLRNLSLRPVLAFGSDLKSHFALGQADKVFLSPYIGDLISEQSVSFFFEILGKYQRWFGIKPSVVCCDLHPNYISRRLAEQYAYKHHLQLMKIQHHYAHLVGVMAEFGIRSKVIGVGYDGTGYGTDENIWGSEIMILDYQGFERTAHLKYLPLVGGDAAITNPELIAKTYLQQIQNSKFADYLMLYRRFLDWSNISLLKARHRLLWKPKQ
jgi:hydrogenase maturation protein HypF